MNQLRILSIFALSSFLLFACGQRDTRTTDTRVDDERVDERQDRLSRELRNDLQNLLEEYYDLKEALVEAEFEEATSASNSMMEQIRDIDAGEVVGLQQRLSSMLDHLQMIADAGNINEQRIHFEPLSDGMYLLVTEYQFNDNPVYRQYCPMAFDNRGAYWLSDEEEIRNPYFGHEMLHCGTVEENIEG